MSLKNFSLILGGASSGKSSYAEKVVLESGRSPVYIATAQAFDAEMSAKIAAHRAARDGQGWTTVEEPRDLPPILAARTQEEAVLLDCATLWLTALVLEERDADAETAALLEAIHTCQAPVVVVSNELGMGVVPETALGRRFRQAQGALNARLAERADFVAVVMAGLPLALKGTPP